LTWNHGLRGSFCESLFSKSRSQEIGVAETVLQTNRITVETCELSSAETSQYIDRIYLLVVRFTDTDVFKRSLCTLCTLYGV